MVNLKESFHATNGKLKKNTKWVIVISMIFGLTLLIVGSVLIHKKRMNNKTEAVVVNDEGVPLSKAGV